MCNEATREVLKGWITSRPAVLRFQIMKETRDFTDHVVMTAVGGGIFLCNYANVHKLQVTEREGAIHHTPERLDISSGGL